MGSVHRIVSFDYQAGQVGGFESGINVDHRDVRRAGTEHSHQWGEATEGRPIADAGRDCEDRDRKMAAHGCRQCAFHSSDHDDRRCQTQFGNR